MNKVYILGAGASAGYENSGVALRPPVNRNFLQITKKLIDKGKLERCHFQSFFVFLKEYYNLSEDELSTTGIDIEEVLTILDLNGKKFTEAHSELLKLIYLTLDKVLYGDPCPHHRRLIGQLNHDDVIITFNWDLLVDNLLSSPGSLMPDYTHPFARYFFDNYWHDDVACNQGPQLLKLHGSLNWMHCEHCKLNYSYIRSGKVGATQILDPQNKWLQCPDCNDFVLKPIIIPPTLKKLYKKWKVINAVWKKAGRALEEAEEITIVGYSLPVTDYQAKWLFLESIAKRKEPLRKLTVVDKYPNGLFDKYKEIFRVSDDNFEGIQGEIKCLNCDTQSV